ncbi:MAG: BON domain-containing protein [Planctomycetes bacterium]|nr:BON domain-containing protein [Planctomycetota bacterium]
MRYLTCMPSLLAALAFATIALPRAVAEERPSDALVASWVKEALQDDPRVVSKDINVNSMDGIVTLSGTTSNLASKTYSESEAKKINGVIGVVNEIKVEPKFRYDWDIAQDIRHRLINSAFIHSHLLEVNVLDGVATLNGEVDSAAQKHWAEMLASEVRGVKEVNNELVQTYGSPRPDKEISDDVIATIARDAYLTGLSITASVRDGVVTLTGSVGNWFQKDRATEKAYDVAGVRQVKNDLRVDWWEERGVRSSMPIPSDADLKQYVRDTLLHDMRIEPFNITVDTSAGHVTLQGSVPSYFQRNLAEQDSRNVIGVSRVSNLLIVNPYPRSDEKIKEEIVSSVRSDAWLTGQDIRVTVVHGVVTLTGSVDNVYESWQAKDLAARIKGVMDVVDDLVVKQVPAISDEAIQQRIKDRLRHDDQTRWIADDIQVEVHDGKAVLRGTVNFWSERSEADQIAYLTEGVTSVENEIHVND